MGEGDFGCGGEVDDSFEGSGFAGFGALDFPLGELEEGGHLVLKTSEVDDFLAHFLMRGHFATLDCLDEFEIGFHGFADETHDFLGYGGREHESLTIYFLRRREEILNSLDLGCKALVEESVRFIKDQTTQLWSTDTGVLVGEDVVEPTRGSDKNVASFSLNFHQAFSLHGTTDSCLDNYSSILRYLPCLHSNLFGKFTSRRYDQSSDI